MLTHALLVRLHVRHGREEDMERFLGSAQPLVRDEPGTAAWFAVRFGRGEYGIFDAFPSEEARQAHLDGAVAAGLRGDAAQWLEREPSIERVDVLASKLPATGAGSAVTRGLLLTFRAKQGHQQQVEQFLRGAQALVEAEQGTVAWFALRLGGETYGIFDVFPDNGSRMSHLAGHVPRELTKHAFSLLGGVPDMDMLQVLASHFADAGAFVGLGVD